MVSSLSAEIIFDKYQLDIYETCATIPGIVAVAVSPGSNLYIVPDASVSTKFDNVAVLLVWIFTEFLGILRACNWLSKINFPAAVPVLK